MFTYRRGFSNGKLLACLRWLLRQFPPHPYGISNWCVISFFIVEWVPNRPLNHFRSCHIMSCEIFLYNFLYCHKQLSSRSLKKKRRLKKVDRKPEKQRLFGNLKQESLFENQKPICIFTVYLYEHNQILK